MEYLHASKVSQSVSSVTQSCPTLCDPMNRSTPGLPVYRQLPKYLSTKCLLITKKNFELICMGEVWPIP